MNCLFLSLFLTLSAYANDTDDSSQQKMTVDELLEGPRQVCGAEPMPVAELNTIFDSFGSLSCETFRAQQKDDEYCGCIESVAKPDNYNDELYRSAIYDAYQELIIQRDNRIGLAQMEALIPVHYTYMNYPAANAEDKSCFSRSYRAIFNNKDDKQVRDQTLAQIQSIERVSYQNFPAEEAQERKSKDSAFLSDMLVQFTDQIKNEQNRAINTALSRDLDAPIPGDLTPSQLAQGWEQAQTQFYQNGHQILRRVLTENPEAVQNSTLIFDSSFELTRNALNLSQLTDIDREEMMRPLASALWGGLKGSDFLNRRFSNDPVSMTDVQVSEEAIRDGLRQGGITEPYQCFSYAHKLINETKRDQFRRNPRMLIERFENEINDNNPVKQILLMSQIEQSLLFNDSQAFLSRLDLTNQDIEQSQDPESATQSRDQALMTLKYTLGKMRCNLIDNENGANWAEVQSHLTELESVQPGTIEWAADLSAQYLEHLTRIEADIEIMRRTNSKLVNTKGTLLRVAKNAGIFPSDKNELTLADIQAIKDSDQLTPAMSRIIARIEGDLAAQSSRDESVREREIQMLEVRAQLADRLGANIANGMIAARTTFGYEVYSQAITGGYDIGFGFIEAQTAIEVAESGGGDAFTHPFFSGERTTRNPVTFRFPVPVGAGVGNSGSGVGYGSVSGSVVREPANLNAAPKLALGEPEKTETDKEVEVDETATVDPEIAPAPIPETGEKVIVPTPLTPVSLSAISDVAAIVTGSESELDVFEHREIFEREERERNVSAKDSYEERRQRYHEDPNFAAELAAEIEDAEEQQELMRVIREENDIDEEDFFANDASQIDGYDDVDEFEAYRNAIAEAGSQGLDDKIKEISDRIETPTSVFENKDTMKYTDQEAVDAIVEREREVRSQAENYAQSREQYQQENNVLNPFSQKKEAEFNEVIASLQQQVKEQAQVNKGLRNQINQTVSAQNNNPAPKAEKVAKGEIAEPQRVVGGGSNGQQRAPSGFVQAAASGGGTSTSIGTSSTTIPTSEVGIASLDNERNAIVDEDGNPIRESSALAYGSSIFQGLEAKYTNVNAVELPRKLSDAELEVMGRAPASVEQEGIAIDTSYFMSLINTSNEISQLAFMDIQEMKTLPDTIDATKPLAIRTRTGHVLVRPVLEQREIVKFEYLGEIKVDNVSGYFDQQDNIISQAHSRLVRYENLKKLIKQK